MSPRVVKDETPFGRHGRLPRPSGIADQCSHPLGRGRVTLAWRARGESMQRHSVKFDTREDSGGVTRFHMALQVVPPCLNEGALEGVLAHRTQAQRALSCRWSNFYGRPRRRLAMRSLRWQREGRRLQWRQRDGHCHCACASSPGG